MRRWTIYAVVFLLLTALGFGLSMMDRNPQNEDYIISVYEALQHPADAQQLSYEVVRKNQERWINSSYRYKQSSEEVAVWYRSALAEQGWQAVKYDVGYGQPFYAYIKDDFLLVLGLHKNNDWTITLHYFDRQKVYEPIE